MIITVASGKGGTGKTLVATSMALSASQRKAVRFMDCDVEAPNAHIFLKPTITSIEKVTVPVPVVDQAACTHCGRCAEVCAFNAIAVLGEYTLTFPELCHGCGACRYLCPEKAITETGRECGTVESGLAGDIRFVHGRLAIGEAMSPPVIRRVKEITGDEDIVIIDSPPGTSCPVIETVRDSDFCLLVTEPTPFGLNDLKLAVATVRQLDIPCGVVINRDSGSANDVVKYCRNEEIPVMMTIPLDMEIGRLYSRGITLAEGVPQWQDGFNGLLDDIAELIDERTRSPQR